MNTSNSPLPPEALAALQRGDLFAAIKAVRRAGGIDLAEAKRMLEAHVQAAAKQADTVRERAAHAKATRPQRVATPGRIPTVVRGDPPGALRWLVVAVVLAVAAWLALGADVGP